MSTLKSLAQDLLSAQKAMGLSDVQLAKSSGVTRQSISRALSGKENFTSTTLLAMADALDLAVLIVPKEAAQAMRYQKESAPVRSAVDSLKDL